MSKRKTLGKKVRFEVFKRDEFTCQYCGNNPPKVILEVDHITPVSKGGDNSIDNLVCSCFDCNRGKGARVLSVVPESLKEKAARIKESEAQLAAYEEIRQAKEERIREDSWVVVAEFDAEASSYDSSKFRTIKKFVAELGLHEVVDAAGMAIDRMAHKGEYSTFKYFCGICWNKIKGQA